MVDNEESNEAVKALKVRLARITAAGDEYDDLIDPHYRRLEEMRSHSWHGRYDDLMAVVNEVGAAIEPLERDLFGASQ
jgi:hypothetical protein